MRRVIISVSLCLLIYLTTTVCDGAKSYGRRYKNPQSRFNLQEFLTNLFEDNNANQVKLSSPSGQVIRLTEGDSHFDGLLQVYVSGQWGYVCDDQWSKTAADVACRQLGFAGGSVQWTSESSTSPGSGKIVMDDVECTGSEEKLEDCSFSTDHDCSLSESIRLHCERNTGCPKDEISGPTKCYGFYTNTKSYADAKKRCKKDNAQLLKIDSIEENHFLSNIFNAYETFDVQNFWYTAGQKRGKQWTWAPNVDITTSMWMKVPGLQVEPVNRRNWNCLAMTNKPARRSEVLDYFFWRAVPCTLKNAIGFVCQRDKTKPEISTRAPTTTKIPTTVPASISSDLTVQLVGGRDNYEGNVEVIYKGDKYRICDDKWDEKDATVICRMLGFNDGGVAFKSSKFGRDSFPILLDEMTCTGDELSIMECLAVVGVSKHDCNNYELAGVLCNKPRVTTTTTAATTQTSSVSVRLVGGPDHAGTVEVTRAGQTGVICDDEWDLQDGHVVCRMLGYPAASSVSSRNKYDYVMSGHNFLFDDVECRGSETNIEDCQHKGFGQDNCASNEVAGVECSQGIEVTSPETTSTQRPTTKVTTRRPNGNASSIFTVRLVGGSDNKEGNVELEFKGRNYRICDDDWDDQDATVVCRMLGYTNGGHATTGSEFGSSKIAYLLDNVDCGGDEMMIDICKAVIGERSHDCGLGRETAGVICRDNFTPTNNSNTNTYVLGQCGHRPYDSVDLFKRKRRSADDLRPVEGHESKIVGGHAAAHGEFPWQARVQRKLSAYRNRHHCGAAIINNYWLLSAAHCFVGRPKSQFVIIVGDHDIEVGDEGEQQFTIDKLILHERYSDKGGQNDIALIKIRPVSGKAIQYNNYVQPVCLPGGDVHPAPGQECLISGWGNTKKASNPYPDVLRGASVPLWGQRECRRYFNRFHRIHGGYDDGMMCSGFHRGGVDTCDGDSGGPYVCNTRGSYTLYGLTSFGFGCAKSSPGIYARVAYYLPWIKTKMATWGKYPGDSKLPTSD